MPPASLRLAATLAVLLAFAVPLPAADAFDTELLDIQHAWDATSYETTGDKAKVKGFEALLTRIEDLARRNPSRPEAQVWEGVVLGSLAGAKGGLGALSLAKRARDRLQWVMAAHPETLTVSANTTLGALYLRAPGSPLSFGDKKRAESLLAAALQRDPGALDANFFRAELLVERGRKAEAMDALRRALAAPARPDRPIADRGRKAEAQALLTKLESRD